ncbi:MarR family winged helix-turn-helix transcriptional regulator [Flavobacterium algicola]|uniref:MarR family winged helix-turn-helix transcriptional regulator n=1 Tax=Flavobacterium algicola TaxID=556529 RepID=UPI001EFD91A8|nr:MarR family transcriptional regulator [Flavobacterium algicola]MCG9792665.1 MarR family transcriptional regulator [Flavobacterium algicola]
MKFATPTSTVLYSIEETIKAYRRLSQQNISSIVPDITVDQALILIIIDREDKTQSEIADLVFKDYASITRIIKLMLNKNYLTKTIDDADKRKAELKITQIGKEIIEKLNPVIKKNREIALNTLSEQDIKQLFEILNKITQNCKKNSK